MNDYVCTLYWYCMYVIELVLYINVQCGMYVYVRLWKCMAYYHI